VLTHNYTGYRWCARHRRWWRTANSAISVSSGGISADWLTERSNSRPEAGGLAHRSGPIGRRRFDRRYGTHAYNLAASFTGLDSISLAADLDSFVEGRVLDDNAHVMLRFKPKGAEAGQGHALVQPGGAGTSRTADGPRLRTKGGLEWTQKDPNHLWYTPMATEAADYPQRCGSGPLLPACRACRQAIRKAISKRSDDLRRGCPCHHAVKKRAGGRSRCCLIPQSTTRKGVAFVEACVASSKRNVLGSSSKQTERAAEKGRSFSGLVRGIV